MTKLTDITGVGDSVAEDIREEGFTSVDDIAEADITELKKVNGIGESKAIDIRSNARDVIRDMHDTGDEDDTPEEGERPDFLDEEEEAEDEPEDTSEDEGATDGVQPLSEASETEDGDDDEPEEFELTIEVDETQFDYLISALVDVKILRSSTNPAQSRVADTLLDEFRGIGGAGEATVSLTSEELNIFHTALVQSQNEYQSNNTLEALNAIKELREQVDESRQEFLY